jgi:hypothetical protein
MAKVARNDLARPDPTATPEDPALALIRAHRSANAALRDADRVIQEIIRQGYLQGDMQELPIYPRGLRGPAIPQDALDRLNVTDAADRAALEELLHTKPTTLEGAQAVIDYFGDALLQNRGEFQFLI